MKKSRWKGRENHIGLLVSFCCTIFDHHQFVATCKAANVMDDFVIVKYVSCLPARPLLCGNIVVVLSAKRVPLNLERVANTFLSHVVLVFSISRPSSSQLRRVSSRRRHDTDSDFISSLLNTVLWKRTSSSFRHPFPIRALSYFSSAYPLPRPSYSLHVYRPQSHFT